MHHFGLKLHEINTFLLWYFTWKTIQNIPLITYGCNLWQKKRLFKSLFDINLPKKASSKYVSIWSMDKEFLIIMSWENVGQMGGQFMCFLKSNQCLHKWMWEELLQSHMLCARRGCRIGLVTNGLEDDITFVILLKWAIIYEIIFKHFKSWAQTLKCLNWIFKIILSIKGNFNQFTKIILWF